MPNQDIGEAHLVPEWIQSPNNPTGASVSAGETRLDSKPEHLCFISQRISKKRYSELTLDFVVAHFPDNVWQRSHPLVVKSAIVNDLKRHEPGPILPNQSVWDSAKVRSISILSYPPT